MPRVGIPVYSYRCRLCILTRVGDEMSSEDFFYVLLFLMTNSKYLSSVEVCSVIWKGFVFSKES